MQIQNISNNYSFKGLYLGDIRESDMDDFVNPCFNELKKLGNEADIFIESTNLPIGQTNSVSVLQYIVKPLGSKTQDNTVTNYLPTDDGNLPLDMLAFQVYSAIENIKDKLKIKQ